MQGEKPYSGKNIANGSAVVRRKCWRYCAKLRSSAETRPKVGLPTILIGKQAIGAAIGVNSEPRPASATVIRRCRPTAIGNEIDMAGLVRYRHFTELGERRVELKMIAGVILLTFSLILFVFTRRQMSLR